MTKKRLFVDMDGTLAVWSDVAYIEQLYEEGYFRNLQPQKSVVESVKQFATQEDYDIYILSAFLDDSEFALSEKKEWLETYLPEIKKENYIFVNYGNNKANYIVGGIQENDYLLDDYTPNLNAWKQEGGTAIKLLNGINHTNGTWQGRTIRMDDTTFDARLRQHLSLSEQEHLSEEEYERLIQFNLSSYEDICIVDGSYIFYPDVMDLIAYEPVEYSSFKSLYEANFKERLHQSFYDLKIDELKEHLSDDLVDKLLLIDEDILPLVEEAENKNSAREGMEL